MNRRPIKAAIYNDTRTESRHFGCSIVMDNLERLLRQNNIVPVWYWHAGVDWRQYYEKMPKANSIDAVIVNGEGTIHHSRENLRADALADIGRFGTQHLHAPVFLINATLFQNSTDLYRKLSVFSRIFVRDSLSLNELLQNGLAGEIVPDLTFAHPGVHIPGSIRSGFGATDSVVEGVAAGIRDASKKFGWDYHPMGLPKPIKLQSRDVTHPRKLLRSLKQELFRFMAIKNRAIKTGSGFIEWIGTKKFIVTGRYHTVTICLLTKTPFIAIESNTPKISALVRDVFGEDRRVVGDFSGVSSENLEDFSVYDDLELRKIDAFLERAEHSNGSMVKRIREHQASSNQ